jgi:hypothetical protein
VQQQAADLVDELFGHQMATNAVRASVDKANQE